MAGRRAGVADLRGPRLLNSKLSPADLKRALAGEAQTLGFDCIGVAAPDATGKAGKYFREFLDAGGHGDMDWLAANPERRMDPRVLWPGVRSIIMLGVNYGPDENPLALLAKRTRGAISAYAQGDDYHDVIKKRLKALARWLVAASGEEVKVFVDTAAVMEKPLAQAAGLGWQGKHTNLVSREFGSWLFLGAIYSASELPCDEADGDHCGSCNACQEICPTAAFPAPYKLDARRCISYLTIENKGPIPHEFRKSIGNRIYGCDDCLAVCPWNKFAQEGREAKLSARAELRAPAAFGSRAARRCRVPRAVHQIAGQAHRPRPLHPQRADRDRQRRRSVAGAGGRALARRCKPAGARRGGMGAVATDDA